jgi:hypothetical protein
MWLSRWDLLKSVTVAVATMATFRPAVMGRTREQGYG